jgi:hypothetical protein
MANTKISALTSASTPLAGTEVLPIVQSSATVKVATNDLTVRNIRANATTGILQVTGPAAASTRVVTVPDANWTAARTDAAQSFTGDQTLSTGNLIQGTAAKGFNFTANSPAAGKTSQLLNWYEEGTWTPALSCDTPGNLSVAYTYRYAKYTRVGNLVTLNFILATSSFTYTTASGYVSITGLPFTSAASGTGLNFSTGSLSGQGIQRLGYTQINTAVGDNSSIIRIQACGISTNQNYDLISITEMPTAGTVLLRGSISYTV